MPVPGEMTEYQKGVDNGLKIGFFMGDLYGRAHYDADFAREFDSNLERFREFLWSSFGNNQTLIEEFQLSPFPNSGINQAAISNVPRRVSAKPMSDMDTSQSKADKDVF